MSKAGLFSREWRKNETKQHSNINKETGFPSDVPVESNESELGERVTRLEEKSVILTEQQLSEIKLISQNLTPLNEVADSITHVTVTSSNKDIIYNVYLGLDKIAIVADDIENIKAVPTLALSISNDRLVAENAAINAQLWATGNSAGGEAAGASNNVKYWAQLAEQNSARIYDKAGLFEPSLAQAYPDVTGITQDTLWIIKFDDASISEYTYTDGDLNGRTLKTGWFLTYHIATGTFNFVATTLSGVATVNGKVPDALGNVTLQAEDIGGLYTQTQVDNIVNPLLSKIAALEAYLNPQWIDLSDAIGEPYFAGSSELRCCWTGPNSLFVKGIVRFPEAVSNSNGEIAINLPGWNDLPVPQTGSGSSPDGDTSVYLSVQTGTNILDVWVNTDGTDGARYCFIETTLNLVPIPG